MFKQTNLLICILLCHRVNAQVVQVSTDEACELKVGNSSEISYLSLNKTWTSFDDPCTLYTCKNRSGIGLHIEFEQIECETSCTDDQVYKTIPSECCGKCFSSFCTVGEIKFRAGEIWKSSDNCTVNECIDTGTELFVTSYKKSCPKLTNCPEQYIEMRDCCPYCNYRSQKSAQKYTEVEFTNRDTYRSHPCVRECVKGQQLTCFYEFVVEEFETMSKACYNCPSNETDCFRPHCIAADGMKRSITVVNRMMPGPSIEVCLDDTIIVDVKNRLMSEGTTIHWHGMHQRKSPYMDGVPHVTQCAIPAGQNFRYNFLAENAGTHFWHSHLGMQRGDGVFGALIIRNPEELHENLYDLDMIEHILITNDWSHMPSTSVFTAHHHGRGDNKPPNILINGRGKYFGNLTANIEQKITQEFKIEVVESEAMIEETTTQETSTTSQEKTTSQETTTPLPSDDFEDYHQSTQKIMLKKSEEVKGRSKRALLPPNQESPLVPYEVFRVVKGHRYRFRHINAGFLNCPIELSVDNHTITAIATDGNNLEPLEATFLVTYAGERWDFIINANQEIGNYFIRARGLMDCDQRFTSSFQMAVLHYHGANDENPSDKPSYNLSRVGLALNALNRPYGQKDSVTVAETKTAEKRENKIMKTEADFKFYLSYDFYGKDNPLFHVPNLYGFNQVPYGRIYTPQLNHITMKMPSTPAMLVKGLQDSTFCNETSLAAQGVNCKETFCECTHVLQVPLNSVVEMILIDEGVTYDANHMFHLHGNYFHVVGMDRLGSNVTLQEVKELDKLGRLKRRFLGSPQKDTVTVPDGGYTIIRFFADNPGIWLLHCHIDFHAEVGMAMILKVGDYAEMPPVPRSFPTCFNYNADEVSLVTLKSTSSRFQGNFLLIIALIIAGSIFQRQS